MLRPQSTPLFNIFLFHLFLHPYLLLIPTAHNSHHHLTSLSPPGPQTDRHSTLLTHSLQIPSEAHSSLDRAITCGFGEVLMPVELGGRLQQQPTRLRTVMCRVGALVWR
jgi:hypothetical protein